MKTKLQTITPQVAECYLITNRNVRTPDANRVEKYANSIRRGEWVVTHQGIAFNADGNLVDGQHRLLAVIQAGMPVDMLVTTNVSNEAVPEMDRNTPRNNATLLGVSKREAETVTIIARILYGGSPSRYQLQSVYDVTCDAINMLPTTARKSLTIAPVKAAFVTAFLISPDNSILENYKKLVLLNVCNLEMLANTPPSIRALYNRLSEKNRLKTSSGQAFAYSLNAAQNPSFKKIHVVETEETLREVRNFYRNTFSL
jgi:hypothetical protein